MTVTSGFPFWEGSTWEWELSAPACSSVTGFGPGYAEIDLAHTAQTWARIMDRLAAYADTGDAALFFPES